MTTINLYNTFSRQKEALRPLKPAVVTIYTCGPTVYDNLTIGNWRTFTFYDTLKRSLKLHGFKVRHVLNVTDVGHLTSDADEGEDKMQKGARREGKTAWEIAAFYTEEFLKGLAALNILPPSVMPRATDYIKQQIEFVQVLEQKGFTYATTDGIYFDTDKLGDYGKLARLDTEHQKPGARVEYNPQKRSPRDFALWKFSPKNQQRDMEWESQWGVGFPGWHLECSVMAKSLLGDTIDIHAGGIDHIPIHHTNEIAQSESANNAEFARIWLHGEFIKVDGKRIGKSEGNAIRLTDVTKRGIDALALRLLYVQSHYRTESNFTWDALGSAATRLDRLRGLAELRFQYTAAVTKGETELLNRSRDEIKAAMADDLNTPKVLEILAFVADSLSGGVGHASVDAFENFLQLVDEALGLDLLRTSDISDKQKHLLGERKTARQKKDFALSDRLRTELLGLGIELNDTSAGALWHKRSIQDTTS